MPTAWINPWNRGVFTALKNVSDKIIKDFSKFQGFFLNFKNFWKFLGFFLGTWGIFSKFSNYYIQVSYFVYFNFVVFFFQIFNENHFQRFVVARNRNFPQLGFAMLTQLNSLQITRSNILSTSPIHPSFTENTKAINSIK